MAVVALVVAATGVATALPGKNTVDSGDIHVRRCGTGENDLQFCSPDSNNNPKHVWIETREGAANQDASFTLAVLPK